MLLSERSVKARISTLTDHLQSGKIAFEYFVAVVTDKSLQAVLRDTSQELSHYLAAISAELFKADPVLHFQCRVVTRCSSPGCAGSADSRAVEHSDDKILEQCCACEKAMITAYGDVLNELFLPPGFKTQLRYQLNEIMYCFSRLKLLKSTTSPQSNLKAATIYLL